MDRTDAETIRSQSNSPQRSTRRRRPNPTHADPADVPMLTVLQAVADPVRLSLLRQLAASEPEEIPCGAFELPIGKSSLTHHFTVLRQAGVLEQRDEGQRRLNRLRREEFEAAFPGLLDLVLRPEPTGDADS